MKLKTIIRNDLDLEEDLEDMTNFFCNSLFNYHFGAMTKPTISKEELEKLGYSDMIFERVLRDSSGSVIAYVFNKNNLLGAYTVDGELYADFKYTEIKNVDNVKNSYTSDYFVFKNNQENFDLYYKNDIIFSDFSSFPVMLKDSYTNNYAYILIMNHNTKYIYDMSNQCFLNSNFRIRESEINFIHSKYKKIICGNLILSFHDNILGNFPKKNLTFSEINNYYINCLKDRYGLVIYNNGKFEEVISCKHRQIIQVFKNRIVVRNNKNYIEIISFQKDTQSNKWKTKSDYVFPKNITDIFLGDDMNEAILSLSNGKKILLSHYLKNNNEQYECDDICYEGNNIFKCFQLKSEENNIITYICNEQAISYNISRDNNAHIVRLDNNRHKIFTSNGKILFHEDEDVDISHFKNYKDENDFMTIEKEGEKNLVRISYNSDSLKNKSFLLNTITGDEYDYRFYPQVVWHNLLKIDNLVYNIKSSCKPKNFVNIIAKFNDFIAVLDKYYIYICDINHNYRKIDFINYQIDYMYKLCVVTDVDKAFVVSNNGIEEFDYVTLINGYSIYKSKITNNFVIGQNYVKRNILKKEINDGIIDSDFKILL